MIKKWSQIWLCTVKKCLIYFKLYCFSRILAIFWEIGISNFTKIASFFPIEESVFRSKFVTVFILFVFFGITIETFLNYKMFLLILRYIESLRVISGYCPRTSKEEMSFLVKDCTSHWLSITNLFLKNTKVEGCQCPDDQVCLH